MSLPPRGSGARNKALSESPSAPALFGPGHASATGVCAVGADGKAGAHPAGAHAPGAGDHGEPDARIGVAGVSAAAGAQYCGARWQ